MNELKLSRDKWDWAARCATALGYETGTLEWWKHLRHYLRIMEAE